MKRIILAALVLMLMVPVFANSQDATDTVADIKEKMKMHQMDMGPDVKKEGKQRGGHKEGMMKMMMEKEMVPTSDGGVIVLSGNRLLKYDKDLELVKEVKIEMDFEGMKKMMEKMKENCPMAKTMGDDAYYDKDND